jgi:hypothetical protein
MATAQPRGLLEETIVVIRRVGTEGRLNVPAVSAPVLTGLDAEHDVLVGQNSRDGVHWSQGEIA